MTLLKLKYFLLFYTALHSTKRISIQQGKLFLLREVDLLKISRQHSIASKSTFLDLATMQLIGLMPFRKKRPHLDPVVWGWKESRKAFVPLWSDLPDTSEACRELIKCGCKKKCRGRYKCRKNELSCTELCACSGQCAK